MFYQRFFIFVAECQFQKISSSFTPGDLDRWLLEQGEKSFLQSPQKTQEKNTIVKPISKYSYVLKRDAQVLSKGSKAIERETLLDLAKLKYAAILQEGESSLPTITATSSFATEPPVTRSEGWALKQAKKARIASTKSSDIILRQSLTLARRAV